jgi:aminoglycoside 3-N-acetyltransferase
MSFAAWGADADRVVDGHAYDSPLGEASPLARLYDLDALVLRLGVDANTSLHLAEYRADYDAASETDGAPVLTDEGRRWVTWEEPASEDDFREVEAAFEAEYSDQESGMHRGPVGEAEATLCRMRPLVDFGAEWMTENR